MWQVLRKGEMSTRFLTAALAGWPGWLASRLLARRARQGLQLTDRLRCSWCAPGVGRGLEERAVGAVALALQVIDRDEPQGGGVDAVAQAPGLGGPVVEYVAQVAVAVGGADLGPEHQVAEVPSLDHVAGLDRHGEARPAGAAVVLVDRCEQRLTGHDVDVDAGLLVVPELVLERRLGALLLGDPVLLRRQPLDGLGVLAVVVRHVSSFAGGAARWVRAHAAPVCNRPPGAAISAGGRASGGRSPQACSAADVVASWRVGLGRPAAD